MATKLNKIPFFETSALQAYNVEAAFRTITSNIFVNENLRGPLPISVDTSAFHLPLKPLPSLDSTSDSEYDDDQDESDMQSTWWNRWGQTWRRCIPF